MIWCSQCRYSSDAMLLVLASHVYDAHDYIRDYDEFLAARRAYDAELQGTALPGRAPS